MGTNVTSGDIRGLLIPWGIDQTYLDPANSDYSQQSKRAGVPTPSASYDLVVQTAGTQNEDLEIKTQNGGPNVIGRFIWKRSIGDYFGRDEPNFVSYFERAAYQAGETITVLDALGLSGGEGFVLAKYTSASANGIRIYKRSIDGVYSSANLYSWVPSISITHLFGCILQLEDGSISVLHSNISSGDLIQLMSHRSIDSGASFTIVNTKALDIGIDTSGAFGAGNTGYEVRKMRARSIRGETLLLINLWAHNTTPSSTAILRMYSSIDGCVSFSKTQETDGSIAFDFADLVVSRGKFIICFPEAADEAYAVILPNSFSSIETIRSVTSQNVGTIGNVSTYKSTIVNKHSTRGQCAAWEDHSGRIYCAFEDVSSGANGEIFGYVSDDGGYNWFPLNTNRGSVTTPTSTCQIWNVSTAIGLKNMTIRTCGAQSMIFYNPANASGITTAGIGCTILGGYSSIAQPPTENLSTYYHRIRYDTTWQSIEKPSASGAGFVTNSAGAGTATEILMSGFYTNISTNNKSMYFTQSPAGYQSGGMLGRFALSVSSGGDLTSVQPRIGAFLKLQNSLGTQKTAVQIHFSTTAIRLIDGSTAGTLGEESIDTTGEGVEVLFAFIPDSTHGKLSAWIRRRTPGAKDWTPIVTNQNVGYSAVSIANEISFGHFTQTNTDNSRWYEFCWVIGANTGLQLATGGYVNPADLHGQFYPERGNFTYVDGGLKISTVDGPARTGDTYQINRSYDYPIDHIFPTVSATPRIVWKSDVSTGLTVPQNYFSWKLSKTIGNANNTEMETDLLSIHLSNINFQNFEIEAYDGIAKTWSSIGTFDNSIDSFTFTRKGASVIASAVNANPPYLFAHELAGCYLKLDDGANILVRKIRTNSSGVLSNIVAKNCVIELSDALSSDFTTGTATIIPNACTIIIDKQGSFSAEYRLKIAAQKTNEMYFKIGMMVFGSIFPFGRQYGRGREISYHSGTEIDISNDGVAHSRNLNNGYREITISWAEGVDTSAFYEADPAPDYLQATTAGSPRPIASLNDIPQFMIGVSRALQGGQSPIVYIPAFQPQTATTWIINRYNDHVLCRISDSITLENVVGNELTGSNQGEVFRVSALTMREII